MVYRYSTAAALIAVLAASPAFAQAPPAPPAQSQPLPSVLSIFIQGMPIGTDQVVVSSGPDGWTIRSSGRIGAPVNITTGRFEMVYDRDWKPQRLEIEGSLRGQPLVIRTSFSGGKANNDIMQAGQQTQKSDPVSADAIVLPNMFFASYEALALRLGSARPGDVLRAYVPPQTEIDVNVVGVTPERILTPGRTIDARMYNVTFVNPGGPLPAEIWTDENSRLLRFRLNAQGLEVARDDVAAVSARVERMMRPGDEQVRMQANGFSLAGTLSRPPGSSPPAPRAKNVPRLPAIVLVPGSGPIDRDETVAGIHVFAQLASALSDGGFLVVRYDKRGVGQSGGREESATIDDFAEDARAVIKYLKGRKDVDPKRIAIVGHSEGGFAGLLAASRDSKNLAAMVLVATPGTTGAELVLEQQQHLLDRMTLPEAERRNRIELQKKIQEAAISGTGWDAIPPGFRRQAETPWFKSFLLFDPLKVMPKVRLPLLVVQGERDRQVPAHHARRLVDAAKVRKTPLSADLVLVDGINHLLVPAPTGEVTEYAVLQDKNVSPRVPTSIVEWLRKTMPEPPARK